MLVECQNRAGRARQSPGQPHRGPCNGANGAPTSTPRPRIDRPGGTAPPSSSRPRHRRAAVSPAASHSGRAGDRPMASCRPRGTDQRRGGRATDTGRRPLDPAAEPSTRRPTLGAPVLAETDPPPRPSAATVGTYTHRFPASRNRFHNGQFASKAGWVPIHRG